ncbi:MAG: FecR domain-containing protein [Treponema sp.]|nr:FecR domain-containing protein [Treponema sp.]
MKKIVIVALIALVSVANVFSQNGVIREFTGTVELRHAGSSNFVPATVGATVAPNTIVSTGFRSTAVIVIGGSVIGVSPLTRLTMAEIQNIGNTQNVNVNLQSGRVRVEVNPPAGTRSNLTIQTPSSTASVRGTTFEMDTNNIIVSEGRVMVNGTGGIAVMVDGGYATHSTPSGIPVNPLEVSAANLVPPVPVGAAPPVVSAPQSDLPNEITFTVKPDWTDL